MVKYFCVIIAILLGFAFFESAILSNIFFLPAIPDFLLISVLYWSFSHGRGVGEGAGFSSGLIIDFLSGCPFGLNSLLRTIIGYISGFFAKTFTTTGILMPAIIVLLGTILKALLLGIISIFYPSIVNPYNIFSSLFVWELGFNTVLAPLVFKFLSVFESLYPKVENF